MEGVERLAMAKFLHTADLHLSRPFGFLPPVLAEERRRDQRIAVSRIAELAIEKNVDIVLVAGDLFDNANPDPTDLEVVTKELGRLIESGKKVFAIPGNHDPATSATYWKNIASCGVHVFLDTEWQIEELADLGVRVCGAAFHKSRSNRRAFEGLALPDGLPCLLLAHASYESYEGQMDNYHPFSSTELESTGASYAALGHYHRFNQLDCKMPAYYAGTPEGISFDSPETGDRFAIIGEIGDDGAITVEQAKINRRVMKSAEIDCTSFESQSSILDAVRPVCEPNALVEVRLIGNPIAEVCTALEEIADRFKESCLYMSIDLTDLSAQTDAQVDDRTIRGRFYKYMLAQIEEASDAEKKRLLRRALELGIAAFKEG